VLAWLLGSALGPAAVALPVEWAADALAGAAQRWFKRLRRTDDLSRLVRAATGTSVDLTRAEFGVVRRLLEDQQTWSVAGRGTVEDLATRIADCLPPRDSRTAGDSHAAALTIARGLLEFAVADLDPNLFQTVLMARLQRMESDQASALDAALLGLHARFESVMEQLKLVLDRLPPGPARRGEIEVYLRTLIDWLNTDPWPRDPQFGGDVLTPATIERKLRITAKGLDREQDFDADEMIRQCGRLVILGGPGSGKTWLAKRAARRGAEDALGVLAAGGALEEVELPLYTTAARLFGAGGDIREAVVSSALGQIGDLGGSRISAALRVFFTERNAPTLLVIDSLDEASGSSQVLGQAGTLPWRIVLTSRPSSWRNQLRINDTDESHRIGELQSLRYPGDVEPFIERWFAGQPERGNGNDLAAQIARRPGLQQAATVPLILAFYCIIGGAGSLPGFRHDLYTKVLNRVLTGRWRGDDDRQPDADACLQTLRAWAWIGAADNHPVSGIGTWADDIPTKRVRLEKADADALDHVATPLGLPDIDTWMTRRRFIHRTLREHLVAEHVAGLPVDQAADVLLPHLWYDQDWEYSAPAALARHPQRDQLLQNLIRRAARLDDIPASLAVIDAGWEVRGLLARVAAESRQDDWSPEISEMIGRARVELAQSSRARDLGGAESWVTSNRQACGALLGLLTGQTKAWEARNLVGGVAQLDPTTEDRREARDALLRLLADPADEAAPGLVGSLIQLAPTAEDKRQARGALLDLLADPAEGIADDLIDGLIQLAPTAEDKRQARGALLGLLADETSGQMAGRLADRVVKLDPTAEDKRQARQALLGLLALKSNSSMADSLVDWLIQLDPTAEERHEAREALLGSLVRQAFAFGAASLAVGVVKLDPTGEDKRQARATLLRLLTAETGSPAAGRLISVVVQFAQTAEDKREVSAALLRLLAKQPAGSAINDLVGGVVQLTQTTEDKRQARDALVRLLTDQSDAWKAGRLVGGVVQLAPTAEDKRQARVALLGLLADEIRGWVAIRLAAGVLQLEPTADDQREAREALLRLLAGQIYASVADDLVDWLIQLHPTADDERQARVALLGLLADETGASDAVGLASRLVQLNPTVEDKRQARQVLLRLLTRHADNLMTGDLVNGMVQLDPTAEDKRRARQALLGSLASQTDGFLAESLVRGVLQLGPTAEDKRRACEALRRLLDQQADGLMAGNVMSSMTRLDPTVGDLTTWRTWRVLPTAELLAAVRRNSTLSDWLSALSSLALLSD
jgi:hypothetical protein